MMALENIDCDQKMGQLEKYTNDKRVFIQLNEFPSGYICAQSILKAALMSMMVLLILFTLEPARIEMMKRFVTRKILSKINDSASCLQFFLFFKWH